MTVILCPRCKQPLPDEGNRYVPGEGVVCDGCLTLAERAKRAKKKPEDLGRDCREPIDDAKIPF